MASWTGRSMGGHISQELIYRIDPSWSKAKKTDTKILGTTLG
jgi:hypothetical protein